MAPQQGVRQARRQVPARARRRGAGSRTGSRSGVKTRYWTGACTGASRSPVLEARRMSLPAVAFTTVDRARVRYAQSIGGEKPTILLTSPWPESIYAFAAIWP